MARRSLKRYLGIVFIGVVVAPAVVLSFLAIRAISHEEAYIEKQMEGSLAAEVAHVSTLVKAQLAEIQKELDTTAVIPASHDPSQSFIQWKQRSPLVEIPFLLSPDYSILWPIGGYGREAKGPSADGGLTVEEEHASSQDETAFLREQQEFLTDSEKTPVYENIALTYRNEILREESLQVFATDSLAVSASKLPAEAVASSDEVLEGSAYGLASEPELPTEPYSAPAGTKDKAVGVPVEIGANEKGKRLGEEAVKQSAMSRFLQSASVRKKVYDKARQEGQDILYRNVEVADAVESEKDRPGETQTSPLRRPPSSDTQKEEAVLHIDTPVSRTGKAAEESHADAADLGTALASREQPSTAGETDAESGAAGRIRSVFISEPLSLSEIVAGGKSGIIPRFMDGNLELLYWQRGTQGEIVGCLIDPREVRERIIGILPSIYSTVRILTVLDELGRPLIVPPGHEGRDWKRPFVAEEVSRILPRWEVVAYLTDPDVITSRAQVATSVTWILILILFVAIAGGGILVVRSTYAEMRLAQQKTTFVANVSHELKTPLTSIRMFAEMLRDGDQPDQAKQKKYLDIMAGETERLTRLVNNVLDFSRTERGEKRYSMRNVDLVGLCSAVIESQRTRLENNGFKVAFTANAGILPTRADEEAIKQVLINLLSNAEKYSAERKEIQVEVGRKAGMASVAVSDRGIGIPPGDAGRIFDEFYRVDDKLTARVKGAGLGLTIARRILKDHGGDLRYLAREGGGSIFEVVLPPWKEGE